MLQYTKEHHRIFEVLEEDAYDVIAALTGAEELMQAKDGCLEGGKVNMCRALTELIQDGKLQGIQEGLQKGAREKSKTVAYNMFRRNMSAEDAAALCSEDLELIKSWYRQWQLGILHFGEVRRYFSSFLYISYYVDTLKGHIPESKEVRP